MAHKLKIFCENPSDGELSNELKSKYQPNEYLLANETNAVLRGATIGTKLIYDVIDCADITLGYDTAPSEFSAQVAAITKGLLAVTNGNMATNEKLGTIKVGYQADSSAENRNYPLKVDANGNAYTNVPWSTDTSGTPNNTPNALVKRDSNGNFSANTITANLTGNASTADRINTKKSIGSNINPVYVDSNGNVQTCANSFNEYYDFENSHIECSYNGTTITIPREEVEKLHSYEGQILFLKLNYTNSTTKYDILKFNDRRQETDTLTYTFANSASTVEISLIDDGYSTLDEILIYPTTTSKSTYANYAEYSIVDDFGSHSKFTINRDDVLCVNDAYIVPRKKLLWSGNVNIKASDQTDFIDIFTSIDSLKGKKLEIWVQDTGLNYMFEPITLKVQLPYGSTELFKKRYVETDDLDVGFIDSFELDLRYFDGDKSFQGRYIQNKWNIGNKTHAISGVDCYVTEIYEIIE